MSAPEVWEVSKNLPPGLWLPTAEEPTDKFLAENYTLKNRPFEDIVDYGAFVVALAYLDQENSGRISFMPRTADINQMHNAGYGPSYKMLQYGGKGGFVKLNSALGFYPRNFKPDPNTLLDRFRWIANYAYDLDPTEGPLTSTDQIMHWGALRNLSPAVEVTRQVLGNTSAPLREIINLPEISYRQRFTYLDLYRFGAKVMAENGGPISQTELNKKYAGQLGEQPHQTIVHFFKTYSRFWLEFDCVNTTSGLRETELLNLGVQRAIAEGDVAITADVINSFSAKNMFASRQPIYKHFRGISTYRQRVKTEYAKFIKLQNEFMESGVDTTVLATICRKFECTPEYEAKLRANTSAMQKLSVGWDSARYVLSILCSGFNLLDEPIMEMQFEDFVASIRKIGIKGISEQRFIFDTVPRFDTDEALHRINKKTVTAKQKISA